MDETSRERKTEWHQTCQQQHQINKQKKTWEKLGILLLSSIFTAAKLEIKCESGIKTYRVYKVPQTYLPEDFLRKLIEDMSPKKGCKSRKRETWTNTQGNQCM